MALFAIVVFLIPMIIADIVGWRAVLLVWTIMFVGALLIKLGSMM